MVSFGLAAVSTVSAPKLAPDVFDRRATVFPASSAYQPMTTLAPLAPTVGKL